MSKYKVFSAPYFPAFGLNTEVSLRIHSECGKIRIRKNSVFGHISRSVNLPNFSIIIYESWFFKLWNTIGILWFNSKLIIIISMCRISIFSSDTTIFSHFNITINITIITNPIFNWVFKIFIVFFSNYKFFVNNLIIIIIIIIIIMIIITIILIIMKIIIIIIVIVIIIIIILTLKYFQNLRKSWKVILFSFHNFWV